MRAIEAYGPTALNHLPEVLGAPSTPGTSRGEVGQLGDLTRGFPMASSAKKPFNTIHPAQF